MASKSLRLTLENNRNVMVQELKAFDGVKLIPPDGTFYSLPDFRAYSNDSVKLSKMLLEKVWSWRFRARNSAWKGICV